MAHLEIDEILRMAFRRINPSSVLIVAVMAIVAYYLVVGSWPSPDRRSTNKDGVDRPQDSSTQVIRAQVEYVFDGDSLKIIHEDAKVEQIRLSGIDAPEKGQPYADDARRLLQELCDNRIIDAHIRDRDRYGRWVADVYVEDTWLNARLVEAGLAWYAPQYQPSLRLKELQNEAQMNSRGLWTDNQAMPPWQFRRQSRTEPH